MILKNCRMASIECTAIFPASFFQFPWISPPPNQINFQSELNVLHSTKCNTCESNYESAMSVIPSTRCLSTINVSLDATKRQTNENYVFCFCFCPMRCLCVLSKSNPTACPNGSTKDSWVIFFFNCILCHFVPKMNRKISNTRSLAKVMASAIYRE